MNVAHPQSSLSSLRGIVLETGAAEGGVHRPLGRLAQWLNRIEEAALEPRAFTSVLPLAPRADVLDRVRALNDDAALLQVPGVRGLRVSLREDSLLFSCVHEGERDDVLYELFEAHGPALDSVLSQCRDYPGLELPDACVRMLLDAAVERRPRADHLQRHAHVALPSMHGFEHEIPDEAYWIGRCARLQRAASRRATREAQRRDPSAVALRGVHAKHHGLVRAKFVVHDALPPELSLGVFSPGLCYAAWLRVSNMSKEVKADRVPDARGLAIKLEGLAKGACQDFLLASHPVFIVKDVRDYAVFQSLIAGKPPSLANKLRSLLFLARRPRERRILKRALALVPEHPLAIQYHSMSAYALGNFRAVKYLVRPVPPLPQGVVLGTDDDLRISLQRSLENAGMLLEFCLVVPLAGRTLSVEDGCADWTEHSEIVPVATIEIEAQNPCTPERLRHAEAIAFSVENSQAEHEPLGSLSRARKVVYRESAGVRTAANGGENRRGLGRGVASA